MTFRAVQEDEHCYFITATIVGWKKLFFHELYARIILDSLQWHRTNNRMKLYAFVVMPNHVHALVKPIALFSIQEMLQGFGSFTAHEFLKQLRLQNEHELLEFFHQQALENRWKEQHQFWQQIQAKNVYSELFIREKMEYIHNNPVAKKWSLVDERWQYKYSSACFYDKGMEPIIPIDDAGELFE